MGDEPDLAALAGGLGQSWQIDRNTYKPYPAGIVFHAVIDACFKLRTQLKGEIGDIAAITVYGSKLLLARGDRPVHNERDARVSIHHSVACVLLRNAAGVREFETAIVFDREIVELRAKVHAELDASLPDGAARVTIRTHSGQALTETVMAARGSLQDPLSDADIEAKLRTCARDANSSANVDALIQAVWRFDELADVNPLIAHARP